MNEAIKVTIAAALQVGRDARALGDSLAGYAAAEKTNKPRAGAFNRVATVLRDVGNGIGSASRELSPGARAAVALGAVVQ
jgi:hypothetical protein